MQYTYNTSTNTEMVTKTQSEIKSTGFDKKETVLLPTEIHDIIWRMNFIPQMIILQHVTMKAPKIKLNDTADPPFLGPEWVDNLEIASKYVRPVSLDISYKSRQTTKLHYSRIIQKAIPEDGNFTTIGQYKKKTFIPRQYSSIFRKGEWKFPRGFYKDSNPSPDIFFNFELDTLAIHPNM
jgi:hypothetical protein